MTAHEVDQSTAIKQSLEDEQRKYLIELKTTGKVPAGPRPEFNGLTKVIDSIEENSQLSGGNQRAIETIFETLETIHPKLKKLTSKPTERLTTNDEEMVFPQLPPHVKANEARANEASPILDALIAYFKYWATRSYDGYHEAVAIWVLATIAARRVVLRWRRGVWPTLYIMIVSISGRHAKTEAADYGAKVITDCGLGFLLAPEESTPQRLLSSMSGQMIPRNYSTIDKEKRENLRLKLAFSAQKGWLYDEFGDFLQEIIKGRGQNTLFYRLLKQLYDNKTSFTYDTVTRGEERIEMPSLSLIGTTAPDSLAPIAGDNSAIWTDGAMARIACIVPPANSVKLQSAPEGDAKVPDSIIEALKDWHERLEEPTCTIIDTEEQDELLEQAQSKSDKKKEKDRPAYIIDRGPLPQHEINWSGSGVREAHELYYQTLVMMGVEQDIDPRLNSNYVRLPDMALKIAMLLASLENDGNMDMRHWARGQVIAERWRYSLHVLMTQLPGGDLSSYGALENAVIDVVTKKMQKNQKFNARDIIEKGSTLIRNAGSPKIRSILDELFSQEAVTGLVKEGQGKKAMYEIKVESK